MSIDNILQMAYESFLLFPDPEQSSGPPLPQHVEAIKKFASLVAAYEREICASICEDQQDINEENSASQKFKESSNRKEDIQYQIDRGNHWLCVSTSNAVARNCAKSIRARKDENL